jgi:hypothetical protein
VIATANTLDIPRTNETVEVPWTKIAALFPGCIPDQTELRDAATEKLVVSQNLDADRLVFQVGLGPNETKKFVLRNSVVSMKRRFENMSKTYGRFVPDRHDDYAWENDKTAHRIYGQALMTWEKEPLTSSGVDIWCKSTPNLIVNKWYAMDDYHRDHGEGADFYSVGPNRGVGGVGIWDGQKMYVSKNFRTAKTLANGPVSTVFELTYDSWKADGFTVSEVKRIRIDGGQYLSRFESTFRTSPPQKTLSVAIGLQEGKGGESASNKEAGWLAHWQPVAAAPGTFLALASVLDYHNPGEFTKDEKHNLAIVSATGTKPVAYYAGGVWSKGGNFANFASWQAYLANFSKRLKSPLQVDLIVE